jgi:predicted membrane channel-forming protein YqfA (hemolysin III family)
VPIRTRKFLGTLATILFVIVYALVAMALAQSQAVQNAPGVLQALYYVVLGLAWILPLMPLIKWMERPD